jgi:hypothetical protein
VSVSEFEKWAGTIDILHGGNAEFFARKGWDAAIASQSAEVESLRQQLAELEGSKLETAEMHMRFREKCVELSKLRQQLYDLKRKVQSEDREVEQILGKALGYPWFKDDQKNFPGATEANGVCVGEHVPVTLAMEAAKQLAECRDAALLEAAKAMCYRCTTAGVPDQTNGLNFRHKGVLCEANEIHLLRKAKVGKEGR